MNKTESTRKLGLFSLVCIAAGNVIGAGIITTTGLAIAQTGRSVWLSYGLAVLFGFLWLLPTCFFASIAKFKGGAYTMITACMGQRAGGIYALWWLPMFLMMALMGTALGMYVNSVLPMIPVKWAGIAISTLFFVINLFGVSAMSKLQNPLTVFLLMCLIAFSVVGFFHLNDGALNVSNSEYYLNGGIGIIDGLMLLIYSTGGHALVSACSWDARRPKKDIPLAIMITTGIIFVLYVSVSFVAGNVLPVADVAGQPLTFVAKVLFPGILFPIFIVGGPIMALATSTNAGYPTMTAPVLGAIRNGWLPSSIAKTNKHGVPWIIYTFMWLLCVIPMLLGVSLSALTAYTVMTMRISGIMGVIAAFFIPTKFKEQWEKSWMHMPNWLYYIIMSVAAITNFAAIVLNVRTIKLPIFIANIVLVAVLAGIALYRYAAGKTRVNITYVFDENAEEEEQKAQA